MQVPAIQWQHCIGGSGFDAPVSIVHAFNNDVFLVGYTASTNGVGIPNHSSSDDFLVCHFDSMGNMKWRKCFGGARSDVATAASFCSDGGLIVCGRTKSFEGDVQGYHFGTNTDNIDAWILKLDSSGNLQWSKCLGGSFNDQIQSVIQLSDGNYLCAGYTHSNDGDVSGNYDSTNQYSDAWLVKLNSTGGIIWQKCFGNSFGESASSVIETSNHRYVFVGNATALGGDVLNFNGLTDSWLVITDTSGNILFSKCYGGTVNDVANKVVETSDGGFLITGSTSSPDGDVIGFHQDPGGSTSNQDYWILKTDSIGNIQWNKCAGGFSQDIAYSAIESGDGGYIVIGQSLSSDGDVTANYGETDTWIVKLDLSGNIVWEKNYGGGKDDQGMDVYEYAGNLYICSITLSNDVDVSLNSGGDGDIWFVKLSVPVNVDEISGPPNEMIISPNPSQGEISVNIENKEFLSSEWKAFIYDNQGKLMFTQKVTEGRNFKLDLDYLTKGIYFLKLVKTDFSNSISEKFIVE